MYLSVLKLTILARGRFLSHTIASIVHVLRNFSYITSSFSRWQRTCHVLCFSQPWMSHLSKVLLDVHLWTCTSSNTGLRRNQIHYWRPNVTYNIRLNPPTRISSSSSCVNNLCHKQFQYDECVYFVFQIIVVLQREFCLLHSEVLFPLIILLNIYIDTATIMIFSKPDYIFYQVIPSFNNPNIRSLNFISVFLFSQLRNSMVAFINWC